MRSPIESPVGATAEWRRGISALAAISLLVGLFITWRTAVAASEFATLVVPIGFALGLLAVIGALTLAEERLGELDVAVLVVAALLYLVEITPVFQPRYIGHTDESRLGSGALRALLAGHNPYSVTMHLQAGTRLLTGGIVSHYEYPPLTLEIGWVLSHFSRRLGEPWIVAEFGVLATAVIVFVLLPRRLRALAVPLVFGFGILDGFAAHGFPVLVALPLLCLAVWRWTDIGSSGRLGLRAAGQGVALGLAAASQQLAWFVAVLLVVALWVVRRGELSTRRATFVTLQFAGIAAAAFLVVNAPFLIGDPHSWASGITEVFRQAAVPYGTGLVLYSIMLLRHCGDLSYFSYATATLVLAVVLITAVGLRRVAAAVPVLASVVFLLSTRSDPEYFVVFIPVWFVWALTTDREAVAAARPVALPARFRPVLTTPWRRSAAVALALAPTVALAVLALVATPPLAVRTNSTLVAGTAAATLQVTITNSSSQPQTPTFSVGNRGRSHRWHDAAGPESIGPGQVRTITLVPTGAPPIVRTGWRVTGFTVHPASFNSTAVTVLPGHRPPPGMRHHRHHRSIRGRR